MSQVRAIDALCRDGFELARRLLDLFFTKQQLSSGLVTKWEGRELLDPQIVEGICCMYFYEYTYTCMHIFQM